MSTSASSDFGSNLNKKTHTALSVLERDDRVVAAMHNIIKENAATKEYTESEIVAIVLLERL